MENRSFVESEEVLMNTGENTSHLSTIEVLSAELLVSIKNNASFQELISSFVSGFSSIFSETELNA